MKITVEGWTLAFSSPFSINSVLKKVGVLDVCLQFAEEHSRVVWNVDETGSV